MDGKRTAYIPSAGVSVGEAKIDGKWEALAIILVPTKDGEEIPYGMNIEAAEKFLEDWEWAIGEAKRIQDCF